MFQGLEVWEFWCLFVFFFGGFGLGSSMRLYLLVARMLLAVGFGVSDGNGERPTHSKG